MNSKDSIEISAIVSSFDGKIDIGGRIKDIKEIKIEDENSKSNFYRIYATVLSFSCGLLIGLFNTINSPNFSVLNFILSTVCGGLIIAFYLSIALKQRK